MGLMQSTISTNKWHCLPHTGNWGWQPQPRPHVGIFNSILICEQKTFPLEEQTMYSEFKPIENILFLFPFHLPLESIPWPRQTQSLLPASYPLFTLKSYSLIPVSIFQRPCGFPKYHFPLPRHSRGHLKSEAKCALLALTTICISYPRHPFQSEHPSGLIYASKEQSYTEVTCQIGAILWPVAIVWGAAGGPWEQLTPECETVHPKDATSLHRDVIYLNNLKLIKSIGLELNQESHTSVFPS